MLFASLSCGSRVTSLIRGIIDEGSVLQLGRFSEEVVELPIS